MQLSVKGDLKHFYKSLNELERKAVKPAANSAINKTLSKLRTEVVRDVAGELQLPQKLIRGRLIMQRSNFRTLRGRLVALTADMRLAKIGKPKQLKQGARVGKHFVKSGFVAKMPSGHEGVFKRKGKKRLPIKEQTLPIRDALQGRANVLWRAKSRGLFKQNFERELKFRINKLNAKYKNAGNN